MKMTLQQKIKYTEMARQKFEQALQETFGERCIINVEVNIHDASPGLFYATPQEYREYERKTGGGDFFKYRIEPEHQKLILYKKGQ